MKTLWFLVVAFLYGMGELIFGYPDAMQDVGRLVVIVASFIVLIMVFAIGRRYWVNYRSDPTSARLLPRHVVLLALGVGLLALGNIARSLDLLRHSFVWYSTPIAMPATTAVAVGLWDMITWLPRRTAPPVDGGRRRDDDHHNEDDILNDA